jgi:hypothetical protein
MEYVLRLNALLAWDGYNFSLLSSKSLGTVMYDEDFLIEFWINSISSYSYFFLSFCDHNFTSYLLFSSWKGHIMVSVNDMSE